MVVKARPVRITAAGLVLVLWCGVLVGVPAAGASPQSSSAQQPRTSLDAEGESYSAVLQTAESTVNRGPSATGGEPSAPDGDLAPPDAEPGAGDGLAPEDGLGAPELGEAVPELGVTDLMGPDGVWIMHDGGREVPLRLLDAAEIAELGDARSLAASAAASAYAPGVAGNASGASASGAAAAAKPDTWFVSDTGQPHLLVGGVNVLFGPHVGGPAIEAVWDRHGVAPGQVSPLGELPNAFLVKTGSDAASLRLADALSAEPGVDAAVPNTFTPLEVGQGSRISADGVASDTAAARRRCTKYTSLWPDELSSCLWHLDASGDYRYDETNDLRRQDPVVDINLGDVWSTTMGAGVTVAVVDHTWNPAHEDLRDNADTSRSTNWGGYTSEVEGWSGGPHGTMVAGTVGARDNTVGGRGVAPRATLVNYNLLDNYSAARKAEALTFNIGTVAVANHSYGTPVKRGLDRAGSIWQRALETSLEQGFGGKGTPHVKSAGNSRVAGSRRVWSGLEAANNYRGIILACAVAPSGPLASYSEEGPSTWVCGLAGDYGEAGVLAPVGDNHYRDGLKGTSFAAPMVSGVVALMRSVNADLTWRDVKVILADTARKVDPQDSGWMSGASKYSSAGPVPMSYSFSYKYGFGLVDADAAVDAAASWALLPPMQTSTASHTGDVSLPGRGAEIELALDVQTAIDFTEHVKVTVVGDISNVRAYRWTLVSPTGTESLLLPETDGCRAHSCSLRGSFDFGTSRHLGENPGGTWKLRIRRMPTLPDCTSLAAFTRSLARSWYDLYCVDGFREILSSWSVVVTGHTGVPTEPVTLSVAAASVAEGGSVDVAVSVGGPAPATDLVVPLAFAGVSAEAGADYSAPASVTVQAGSSSATATISIAQDSVYEGLETFAVGLRGLPLGYRPESGLVVVTITDDDPMPVMSLHAASASVAEGGSVAVTARLSGLSSKDVTADLSATAVAPAVASDGRLGPPAVLTIPAGSTESSGSVAFTAAQNDVYEVTGSTAKTFEVSAAVRGGNGVADPAAITVRIDDDESAPLISIAAGPAVVEGSAAQFTLTAIPTPSADLAVSASVASQGAFGVSVGAQTVAIPASGRAVLSVATAGDSISEPDGTITVTLVDGLDYNLAPSAAATVGVRDDDGGSVPVRVSLASADASVSENGGWTDVEISLSRTLLDGETVSVPITVTGTPGSDWTLDDPTGPGVTRTGYGTATAVEFGPGGRTAVMRFEAVDDDATVDRPITFAFGTGARAPSHTGVLAGITLGGALTVTITNNDLPPACAGRPTVSVSDAAAARGDDLEFVISLSCRYSGSITAHYYVWYGDFGSPTESVTFVSGDMSATVRVPTVDVGEVFLSVVWAPGAANALAQPRGTGTVTETLPVVSIGAGADVTEGHNATFTVTAAPAPARPLAVSVSVSAVGDFGATTGARMVTIPTSGSTTLSVSTADDSADEADGSVTVTLIDGAGYDLGADKAATVVVADDDDPPPQVDITAGSGGTEGTDVVFTITAAPQPAANLDVAVAITASGDFGVTTGTRTATISSGTTQATLTIATADDGDDEPDGGVTAALIAGSGYTVGPLASETAPVTDDDDPPLVIPEVSIAAAGDVTEGADAVFTVTATPAAAVQVAVTVTTAGDYAAAGPRTVNVPSGGTTTLTIPTTGDSTDEADGSVTATLDAPGADSEYTVSAAESTAAVAVFDDDVDPLTVYMIFFATSIAEDGAGDDSQAHLRIAPTRALRSWETLTVPLRVTGGDEGTHWTMRDLNDRDAVFANEFEVVFGPGDDGVVLEPGDQRAELVLTAVDDSDFLDQEITVWYGTGARAPTLNGSTEGVTLGISWGPDGVERADGSTTVVIIDSDEPPPQIDITAATGGTEGTAATFTVTASKPATADLDVTVDVASAGEWGATVGTQTVTIPQGATQTTLTIATVDDDTDEPDGTITATLAAGSGYTVGQQSTQTAHITDDDDPPPEPAVAACVGKPTVSVADATAARGDDLEFVISLSCRSSGAVTVYYAVALDRKLGNVVTITVNSDETGATVNVPTAGIDADIEFHIVYLIGAANYRAKATSTITD
ncbi:S8 family serine peptidase [Candidatus Poriferisodalis sp.]|uniref:S8 family serine peptidase n=1 Tax=Candidatus Poriferisodalis sp. TaxID=3101277 RepID=UPI003B02C10E